MQNEERDIQEILEYLQNTTFKLGDLANLSDLDQDEISIFEDEWPLFDLDKRRTIARSMQELTEESLELDFRAIFLSIMQDVDPTVRHAAVLGLLEDTRRSTLSRLLELLVADPDTSVRASVATVLGAWTLRAAQDDIKPSTSIEIQKVLLDTYHNPTTPVDVRRRILESLGYLGELPAVVEAIEDAATLSDIHWQQSCLAAMGRTGMVRWLPTIQSSFDSDEPSVRFEAARAAGEMAELAQPLVQDLAELTIDDDMDVATAAIWSLGQIGGEHARKLLDSLAKTQTGPRSTIASEALHELEFFADPMNAVSFDDDEWNDYTDDDEWEDYDPEVLN